MHGIIIFIFVSPYAICEPVDVRNLILKRIHRRTNEIPKYNFDETFGIINVSAYNFFAVSERIIYDVQITCALCICISKPILFIERATIVPQKVPQEG